ncbi:tetratricopeptide repeat protein [uncultured Chitinophaga sp.]|jgi:Flp pilus assembly protein TadD, contains TPR repeats|uniref:tetratricopeptide repeat protein n=1 Tax=uncultured Chitinophaga sp. TaxID=339340 RepID=UPI002635E36E|nr:tetratricopeptide repeat protein [uncultured Chitinophaga sp.]
MKKIALLYLWMLACISYAHSQDNTPLTDSTVALTNGGEYGEAIAVYTRILSQAPDDAEVLALRGHAYAEINEHEKALQDLALSLNADPSYWPAYRWRADLETDLEDFEAAIRDYDEALQYADSAADKETILVNRAVAKRLSGDHAGAAADFREALKYNPNSVCALENLGGLLPHMDQPQEAIACLEKAIQLDSTFEGGYGNLAYLYSNLGQYQKALDISNRLLSFKPGEAYALNNRGYIKYKLNDLQGALEDINNAINVLPVNAYAFKNRGLIYAALKRNSDACTDFQKALSLGFARYHGTEVTELIETLCKMR